MVYEEKYVAFGISLNDVKKGNPFKFKNKVYIKGSKVIGLDSTDVHCFDLSNGDLCNFLTNTVVIPMDYKLEVWESE